MNFYIGETSHNFVHGQDAHLVDVIGGTFAVADGVSNYSGLSGENRSAEVARRAVDATVIAWRDYFAIKRVKDEVDAKIKNMRVDGASTLSAIHLGRSRRGCKLVASILHVGDSGIVLATTDEIQRLTPAHNSEQSNVVTGFLEAGKGFVGDGPLVSSRTLPANERFSIGLFTDGALDGHSDEELHEILFKSPDAQRASDCAVRSNPRVGLDDATALVIRNFAN